MDTAADMVTMAAAPAVLAWSALTRIAPDQWVLAVVASSVYIACAVARLVNYARRGHRQKEFSGMPSPAGNSSVVIGPGLGR